MTYSALYAEVQSRDCPISTRWLKERALALSTFTRVKEQWSGLIDAAVIRGFYIEGPLGPPAPLTETECLIVLSREMCKGHQGDYWRRFVYTKELMHIFDEPSEKASDAQTFDAQIEKFRDPRLAMSPQFRAEMKAFWRALGVLCPESQRADFKEQLQNGAVSLDVVSASLRLPAQYARELMRPDFDAIIASLK